MTKARTLADFISDGSEFADGTISVAEVSGAAPLASPSFTGATSIASGSLSVTGATGIGLGAATPAQFGSGVPTIVFQGTAANGRGGAINFREYAASGDGAITSQIYSTDGADGYGFVLNAEQGNLKLNAGGLTATKLEVTTTGVVINEDGGDNDFRIESDGNTHMLFVDASANRIGIGTSSLENTLQINGEAQFGLTSESYHSKLGANALVFNRAADSFVDQRDGSGNLNFRLGTGYTTMLKLGSEAVFNDGGADRDFRIESDSNTHMLFVDAGADHVNIGTSSDFGGVLNVAGVINQNRLAGITKFTDLSGDIVQTGNNNVTFASGSGGSTQHSAVALWADDHSSYSGQIHLVGNTSNGGSVNAAGEVEFWTFNGSSYTLEAYMGPRGYVFNEASRNVDFRVESNLTTHMLYVDAGNDAVIIGDNNRSTSDSGLSVVGTVIDNISIQYKGTAGGHHSKLNFVDKRDQVNAIVQNTLINDGVGTAGAHLEFDTAVNGTLSQRLKLGGGTTHEAVFNEDGLDYDFRIESDTNANMLFVNAGENSVGIGTSTTDTTLSRMSVGLTGAAVSGDTDGATIGKGAIFRLVDDTNWGTTDATEFLLGGGTGGAVGQISSGIGFSRESNATWGTNLRFYTHSTSTVTADIDELNEQMRITSSGAVYVATTSTLGTNPAKLEVFNSGGARIIQTKTDTNGNTNHLTFNTLSGQAGMIYTNTLSTTYSTSSDYRLKENVVELTGATDRLKQLNPSRFNFIADADTTVDGFLAHEVQSVVPEAIHGTKDEVDADGNPVYQGIDQSKLVPLLVATIKELEARITALENA